MDAELYDIFGLPRPRELAPEEQGCLDRPWRRSARGNRYVNLVFTGVNIVVYPAGNSWAFRIATLGENKMLAREDGFGTELDACSLPGAPAIASGP